VISLLLSVSVGWACGGYAAAEKIAYAERVGLTASGVSIAMAVLAALFVWRRGISGYILVPMVGVAAAHPGLWMEPVGADCGREMILASIVFTLQSAALMGWVLARPRVARRIREEYDQDSGVQEDKPREAPVVVVVIEED
jgi:hypothetical protein